MIAVLDNKNLLKEVIAKRVLREIEISVAKNIDKDITYFKEISLYNIFSDKTQYDDIFIDYEYFFGFPKSFSCLIEGLYTTLDSESSLYLPEILLSYMQKKDFNNKDLSTIWLSSIKTYLLSQYSNNEEFEKYKKELIAIIDEIEEKRIYFKESSEILNNIINSIIVYKNKVNSKYYFLNDIAASFLNSEEIYSIFLKYFENEPNELEKFYKIFIKNLK